MKCTICNRIIEPLHRFTVHCHKIHGLKSKEYYDLYLAKPGDGKCEICGKETGFLSMANGYRTTCSLKCSRKTTSCREKLKNTNIERYGAENPFQSDQIKSKIRATNIKRYGVENPGQIDANKQDRFKKMRETCVSKYGVEFAFHNDKGKNKSVEVRRSSMFDRINGFDTVEPLFDYNNFNSILDRLSWKCLECGKEFQDNLISGKTPRCPSCHPPMSTGTSQLEQELQDFLESHIAIERNRMFIKDDKRYELDVYMPSKNIGVEFNGLWWHSELAGKDRGYHLEKSEWFEQNFGMQVIHVFENEWLAKRDIVESILLNKLGLSSKRVHARKCEVRNVRPNESNAFLDTNHLQGGVGVSTRIGLYYRGELVSLMTFGKPRFSERGGHELVRFCNATNTSVVGGFSKLLKAFDTTVGGDLISYCDRRYSIGNGYERNGFEPTGISPPNYWYFKRGSCELKSRIQFQKHKLAGLLGGFDPELSEWENMQANGWNRIWDCGNLVFVRSSSK